MPKAYIKEFPSDFNKVPLKNNGITISVCDSADKQTGKLQLNNTGVKWFPGNSTMRGYKVNWNELVGLLKENGVQE